jgi:Family of unknown function (DUF6169)
MSIPQPYRTTYRANKYYFETDNSVDYSVEFTDGVRYFMNLPPHIPVFEFNVKVINAVDIIGKPYDPRVEATIVDILSTFFNDNKNSLIYICDNLDNRQRGRRRKFDGWFRKSNTTLVEKYDIDFSFLDMQFLTSFMVHTQNPHKDLLIKLFQDIYR